MKIFLIGFMGSGKTYCGKQLSGKLHIPFYDLDELIVTEAGKTINEIFAEEGEEYFRLKEKEILHTITESHETFIMACGGGTPCYFNNIEYMNESGVTVWMNTPVDILHERLLKEKESRPLLKELSHEQLKSYIIKKFADRKMYYEQAAIRIDDDQLSTESLIQKIFHA
jgi:shikimate kinase